MQNIALQGDKKKFLDGDIPICRRSAEIALEKTWKFDKGVGTVAQIAFKLERVTVTERQSKSL